MEQLLKILEDNARLPIEDIATMLNKSPAEVAAMIDLARAQGIIKDGSNPSTPTEERN